MTHPDVLVNDESVVVMTCLSWDTLTCLAAELGVPTDGNIAWAIWRKSNYEPSTVVASQAMRAMGYEPFKGYPLVLTGPRPAWAEAIHQALESAYDEIRRGESNNTGPNPIMTNETVSERREI